MRPLARVGFDPHFPEIKAVSIGRPAFAPALRVRFYCSWVEANMPRGPNSAAPSHCAAPIASPIFAGPIRAQPPWRRRDIGFDQCRFQQGRARRRAADAPTRPAHRKTSQCP